MMLTIICATNRPGNNSSKVSQLYRQILERKGIKSRYLSMENLPPEFAFQDAIGKPGEKFQQILSEYIIPATHFVIILPEYNGSFPGIFKLFIDSIDPKLMPGKKAALVGISGGRAGNLRGMDHMTGILNYLDIVVFPSKLPISRIRDLISAGGEIKDDETIKKLEKQAEGFIRF